MEAYEATSCLEQTAPIVEEQNNTETVAERVLHYKDSSSQPPQGTGRTDNANVVQSSPVPPAALMSSTSLSLLDKVREYLNNEGITYQTYPPRGDGSSTVMSMYLSGKNGNYKTFIEVKPLQSRVLTFCESPVKCPVQRRSPAAEYLMRCNFNMALGNLELDFNDGEIRFRNGIDVEGGVLSCEMLRQLIMVGALTMDRFFPGLMETIYNPSRSPIETFEECRNPPSAQPPSTSQ